MVAPNSSKHYLILLLGPQVKNLMTQSVVICADGKASAYVDVLLKSFCQNRNKNSKTRLDLYLVTMNYPSELISEYQKLFQQYNFKLNFIHVKVPDDCQQLLNNITLTSTNYSVTMYLKLLLAKILPENVETCLYLDSNTMVLDDISALLELEIAPDKIFYACQDHLLAHTLFSLDFQQTNHKQLFKNYYYLDKFKQAFKEITVTNNCLGIPDSMLNVSDQSLLELVKPETLIHQSYYVFNTGMLLMNLKLIRKRGLINQYLEYLTNQVQELPHEQLFLNLIHKNDWQVIPDTYNYQVGYVEFDLLNLSCYLDQASLKKVFKYVPETTRYPKLVNFAVNQRPIETDNTRFPYRNAFFDFRQSSFIDMVNDKVSDTIKCEKLNKFSRLDVNGYYDNNFSTINTDFKVFEIKLNVAN